MKTFISLQTAAIIGIAAGGGGFLLLLTIIIVVCITKKCHTNKTSPRGHHRKRNRPPAELPLETLQNPRHQRHQSDGQRYSDPPTGDPARKARVTKSRSMPEKRTASAPHHRDTRSRNARSSKVPSTRSHRDIGGHRGKASFENSPKVQGFVNKGADLPTASDTKAIPWEENYVIPIDPPTKYPGGGGVKPPREGYLTAALQAAGKEEEGTYEQLDAQYEELGPQYDQLYAKY